MKSVVEAGKDGIIYTTLIGSDSVGEVKEWAERLKKAVKEGYEKGGKVNVLTDLTHVKLTQDIKSRQIIADMQKENTPYIKKSAAFTTDIKVRFLTRLITKISGRRNFIVFKTKQEALDWLSQKEARKSREDVIEETVFEVYHYIKENPDADLEEATDYVKALYDYSGMEGEELELFSVQLGTANIAFNYIKEHPEKEEHEISTDIMENYGELLQKYSQD